VAVGVLSLIFSLSTLPSPPEINLAVPWAKVIARSDLLGSLSNTTLSMTIRVCSVIRSLLSSTKRTCIRPSPVRRSSFDITSKPLLGSNSFVSLTTCRQPTARSTAPISSRLVATCGSTRIRLTNTNRSRCRTCSRTIEIYLQTIGL
jgi:hypothetical protein